MTQFIQLMEQTGVAAVDYLWLPVVIWTVLSLIVITLLKYNENLAAVYKYHFSIAISAVLPMGILLAALVPKLFETAQQTFTAPLFVIQNPVAVVAGASTQTGLNIEPAFWVGLLTLLVAIVALVGIMKLGVHFIRLRLFVNAVKAEGHSIEKVGNDIMVLFSDRIDIPCTFGWFNKKIVLPAGLKTKPESYKMALRHELTHIENYDNVINTFLQAIKALFNFHPLVHYFSRRIDEYREICCDLHVLSDPEISQKKYAKLLFELSTKQNFKQLATVNMAVNPSTLKKRIHTMTKQAKALPSVKQSIMVTLLLAFTFIGFMACSDVTDNGLTVGEVKEVQRQAANKTVTFNVGESPLYVLNGEVLPPSSDLLKRLKPEYIKSIEVLKGESATEAFGEKGKNGVIKIKVMAKEKALNDLKTDAEMKEVTFKRNEGGDDVYLAVDQSPQLKNPKTFMANLSYPMACVEAGVEGTVYVAFTVNTDGSVRDGKVIKGIGEPCDQAALDYIMDNAEFTPGKQGGKAVPVRYAIPLVFKMKK